MTPTKKSSSSEDDSTLYMTDDLAGRLSPEDLVKSPEPVRVKESEKYIDASVYDHTPEPSFDIPTTLTFTSKAGRDDVQIQCTLQVLSFGDDGWRCTVDGVDPKQCIEIAKLYAERTQAFTSVVVHNIVTLTEALDITVHFGSINDKCSVSVAADFGKPI
jgi:hypothetical protein